STSCQNLQSSTNSVKIHKIIAIQGLSLLRKHSVFALSVGVRRNGASYPGKRYVRGFPLQTQTGRAPVSRTLVAISAAAAVAGTVGFAGEAEARDHIKIVGSSTVFPYTQAVAEEFTRKHGRKAP